ncbi:hypothetical protein EDD21DRAFT_388706 [Dissophora ornata]|nr:hypothetical protein BGZ58_000733 [Dissophora ornata]KAI8596293.1 hypothetical protein EDD21DRAFT_388706 [Dissophora ornata]
MNQFTETTRSTINTIKAHALLAKALSNDSKPTPGYLFPEIARLTQSPATSSVVLTQLLKTITPSGTTSTSSKSQSLVGNNGPTGSTGTFSSSIYPSSPHVLLKTLKILRQLAQSGSVEFRTNLARRGKGPLVEMVGYRGQWDEIHGDRFNEDVRAVAEDLIEYMHANPVREEEQQEEEEKEEVETTQGSAYTDMEAAVLKNSTQGLQGFGNPEYDDSDSEDDDASFTSASRRKKKTTNKPAPPLPGFGNPAFEKENVHSEPTLMTRLVDRLQEMTAPPPPMAMRAAHRQQEQRRQKLFVGEYSMREDGSTTPGRANKDGSITFMGVNPFKRTARTQGMAAGGWGEKALDSSGVGFSDFATSRVFPQSRPGTRVVQFRNTTSASIYELAQHIQTNLVRSKLQGLLPLLDNSAESGNLLDTGEIPTPPPLPQETVESGSLVFWGTAKDICDIVLEELEREKSGSLVDHLGETALAHTSQGMTVMTGLVRDMIDWIEQEDWERRLRYLFVLDALLAHPRIEPHLLSCSALPVLSKTLAGPLCEGASQRSVHELSAHFASQIKRGYNKTSRSRTVSGVPDGNSPSVTDAALPNMTLLDIGGA